METTQYNSLKPTFLLLKYTFVIVPILSGLDKFTNILTQWDKYLNPAIGEMLPFSPHTFMMIVGVIEIAAGILVLFKPAIGGFIGGAWLAVIAIALLLSGQYLDTAVRDMVMAIAAFAMSKLALYFPKQ